MNDFSREQCGRGYRIGGCPLCAPSTCRRVRGTDIVTVPDGIVATPDPPAEERLAIASESWEEPTLRGAEQGRRMRFLGRLLLIAFRGRGRLVDHGPQRTSPSRSAAYSGSDDSPAAEDGSGRARRRMSPSPPFAVEMHGDAVRGLVETDASAIRVRGALVDPPRGCAGVPEVTIAGSGA